MLEAIDHIVIVVADLERAIHDYGALGFTVVRGGRHNIGTHNALIAFADGSYMELIAFLAPVESHPWYQALAHGGGLVDFCVRSDSLADDVEALTGAGVSIGEPFAMSRERPDGYRLAWTLSIPNPPFNGCVPFIISDDTPRDERVPRERTHRNGASGIARLTIAVRDASRASRWYEAVLARKVEPVERSDLDAAGVRFMAGPHEIELVAPRSPQSPVAALLNGREGAPYEAVLTGNAPAPGLLDPALAHGARLRISSKQNRRN